MTGKHKAIMVEEEQLANNFGIGGVSLSWKLGEIENVWLNNKETYHQLDNLSWFHQRNIAPCIVRIHCEQFDKAETDTCTDIRMHSYVI